MRFLGVFGYPENKQVFLHGNKVILKTNRGQEAGTILCEATPEALARIPADYEEDRVIRPMSQADEVEYRRILRDEVREFARCREIVRRMNIRMNLVKLSHLFGGERIIVYYVAEGRIDFRELVKVLASEFQTRIEMRQIGVRDETKLLADFGDCGREVCCNTYLIEMPPVSMKMAKLQKATLNPTKISGRCGRLKCCLRYEYDVYTSLQRELPGLGKQVETPDGIGKVVSHDILARRVCIELGNHGRKYFTRDELKPLRGNETSPFREPEADVGEELDLAD
ncbi:MAG TPA: signal peptidase [Planctomycetaceae bacterium]|nr:signal peptidase [Planctomycetaceae bacterium]